MKVSREIKFRAFIKELGTMHKVLELYCDGGAMVEGYEYPLSAEQIVLIQYTGADDKNGNELHEGDIIKSKCYPFYSDAPELHNGKDNPVELNYLGVVGIDVDGVYYDLKVVSNRVSGRATGGNISDLETFEIIGNIYENPELLKVNK